MPLLDYFCSNCNHTFEELVKEHDKEVLCPKCGKPSQRKWSGTIYSSTGKKIKKCNGKCSTCSGC